MGVYVAGAEGRCEERRPHGEKNVLGITRGSPDHQQQQQQLRRRDRRRNVSESRTTRLVFPSPRDESKQAIRVLWARFFFGFFIIFVVGGVVVSMLRLWLQMPIGCDAWLDFVRQSVVASVSIIHPSMVTCQIWSFHRQFEP